MKWLLPICMVVLAGLSLLILRSIVPTLATTQAVFFVIGAGIFFGTQWWGIERWLRMAPLLYVLLLLLLLVPLAIGKTTRGIAGWIDIGTIFSIQPSQLAIPVVLLVVGPLLARFDGKNLRDLAIILALLALPAGLILIEPDLGTTLVFLASLGAVLWVSKLQLRFIATLLGLSAVALVVGWLFVLKPYQKERIFSFASPQATSSDSSYNARQALIAVGSGEITGRGLGEGIQSHLRFLPERQTDFVFASFAEEVGFIGSLLLLALYVVLILTCLWIGLHNKHPVAKFLGVGVAVMVTVQAGVNMGMNMGLLPITGITLPLVSYGGSSIVAVSWLLGLVQSLVEYKNTSQALHLG